MSNLIHTVSDISQRGYLWAHHGQRPLHIFKEDGTPLDEGTVTRLYAKLLKSVGLRHNRLHDFRHLHATELLKRGIGVHLVAERLGHADVSTTLRTYAHKEQIRRKN